MRKLQCTLHNCFLLPKPSKRFLCSKGSHCLLLSVPFLAELLLNTEPMADVCTPSEQSDTGLGSMLVDENMHSVSHARSFQNLTSTFRSLPVHNGGDSGLAESVFHSPHPSSAKWVQPAQGHVLPTAQLHSSQEEEGCYSAAHDHVCGAPDRLVELTDEDDQSVPQLHAGTVSGTAVRAGSGTSAQAWPEHRPQAASQHRSSPVIVVQDTCRQSPVARLAFGKFSVLAVCHALAAAVVPAFSCCCCFAWLPWECGDTGRSLLWEYSDTGTLFVL